MNKRVVTALKDNKIRTFRNLTERQLVQIINLTKK